MFFDTETLIHIPTWIDYVLNILVPTMFMYPLICWSYGSANV